MNLDHLSKYRLQMLAVLRIMTALLFIAHGTSKLFNFPDTGMQSPLFSLFGLAGVLEIAGGLMILIGLFTRIAAFVLAGMMAVAYFMIHAPGSFFPAVNQGDAAVLFCFIFLYIFISGPGAWSVDASRSRA